ncbi:hypothetical protein Kpol_1054p49 [Vanderwaltozyma polyspora DSM 70294]|uniref:LicD/FKTN/FKRP nucleotidyltransferase domain-containing protein n=1 Tax=Vanderwaltozyma polyspora (strain ATCC 22028 / DSM 70294 / BCRC 21397 / CBS 2163 / NBRC 10782 / NRRL Y-8283 / UCD 57-17) TaxID=436907 RepID=A7TID6_VANPO|nr:uncharacterized protein Kpol_1054p49 [Vanderwaltozyma polyspora DSM 70294]EDO18002.1 hypothetical protein Kpol_1054p49 [Vanderwaltozyma polyspora DSM 70294]
MMKRYSRSPRRMLDPFVGRGYLRLILSLISSFIIFKIVFSILPSNDNDSNNKSTNSRSASLNNGINYLPQHVQSLEHQQRTSMSNLMSDPLSFLNALYSDSSEPLSDIQLGKLLYKKLKYDSSYSWFDTYELQKDLLTIRMGTDRGTRVDSINQLNFYENDPRLIWSVYLDHFMNSKTSHKNSKVPFAWYDWAESHDFNKLLAAKKTKIPCHFVFDSAFELEKLTNLEDELGEFLFIKDRIKYNEPLWYRKERKVGDTSVFGSLHDYCKDNLALQRPEDHDFKSPFKVTTLYDKVRPEVYQIQARNHIMTSLVHPLSMTILNSDKSSYRIPVEQREASKNIIQSGLLHDFLERHSPKLDDEASNYLFKSKKVEETPDFRNNQSSFDYVFDHNPIFDKFVESDFAKDHEVDVIGGNRSAFHSDFVYLNEDDFRFDVVAKIKELEESETSLDVHDKSYLESLKFSFNTHPVFVTKYFSEPNHVKSFAGKGWHRDKRFFNGDLPDDSQEYFQRLNAMIRTFQKFTKANGIISWLAHGTVYGYLYDGLSFPWDNDYDLQMPIKHLHLLAQYFNQTLVLEDPREGNGRYLVDIGSSITVRTNGNGKNNIDARFVDIDSGLYIDITGLASTSAPVKHYMEDYIKKLQSNITKDIELNKTLLDIQAPEKGLASLGIYELQTYAHEKSNGFDKRIIDKIDEMAKNERSIASGNSIEKKLSARQRYSLNDYLKIYNCRNHHFSTLELLSPLRTTIFHGVTTFVPNNFIRILNNEYRVPDEYGYVGYQNKAYVPEFKAWFRTDILKKCGSIYSWYPNLRKLSSPIKRMKLTDVKTFYYNLVKAGYEDLVSILYMSYSASSFRVKELEIQYDAKLKLNEKREYLNIMRNEVAPRLNAPGKDPLLFSHERKLWDMLSRDFSDETLSDIRREASQEVLRKLWKLTESVSSRSLELFDIPDRLVGNKTFTLNDFGMNLYHNNRSSVYKIFKKDPILLDEQAKDSNK